MYIDLFWVNDFYYENLNFHRVQIWMKFIPGLKI